MATNTDYYRTLAPSYELFFRDFRRALREEGSWLRKQLPKTRRLDVLDASCGTGKQAIPIARLGHRVTASDPVPEMLEQARRLAGRHARRITFVRTDFEGLGERFRPEFDIVISMGNGLCHLDSYDAIVTALSNIKRCCKDGAVCIVGTKDFDRILHTRSRFHRHRVQRSPGGASCTLFEVWDYQDPLLIITTHRIHKEAGGNWGVQSAQTREFMLTSELLESAARSAEFVKVERIDHPYEAAYRLLA